MLKLITLRHRGTDFLKRNQEQRWEPAGFLPMTGSLLSSITMIPLEDKNAVVSLILCIIQEIFSDNHSGQFLSDLLKGSWEEDLTYK